MEGLKRQREEEAWVAGQLFAKKREKCGPALLRRERGRVAIIKRSPVQLRPIVRLFLVMLYPLCHGFSFSFLKTTLHLPSHFIRTFSALRLALPFTLLTRFICVSAVEITSHPFHLPPHTLASPFFSIASSLTFIRALLETFLLSQLTPRGVGRKRS